MIKNILVVKETRANETRVALVPEDVRQLINKGYHVFVEHHAGMSAGYSDDDYQRVGASIRVLEHDTLPAYKKLFNNIQLIVRAKRPDRAREVLENQAIAQGGVMIGALDPLEKNTSHIKEYQQAGMVIHSIDQLKLSIDDPMNVLAAMSNMAGKFALLDAISKYKGKVTKVVIIGYGVVGRSALAEAMRHQCPCVVILSNKEQAQELESQGIVVLILDKESTLAQQQAQINACLLDASIVITSARTANQAAPLLIPKQTLANMLVGSVIVDMALSEGGNVEGSHHDATVILGNNVIVTNVSGYPKVMPHEASILWSQASRLFIERYLS